MDINIFCNSCSNYQLTTLTRKLTIIWAWMPSRPTFTPPTNGYSIHSWTIGIYVKCCHNSKETAAPQCHLMSLQWLILHNVRLLHNPTDIENDIDLDANPMYIKQRTGKWFEVSTHSNVLYIVQPVDIKNWNTCCTYYNAYFYVYWTKVGLLYKVYAIKMITN